MRSSGWHGPRRKERVRCAIYTRKSSEEGLEQEFNLLQAQRESCEAFIASQRHEKNRTYLGEIIHKGQSRPGEHRPITEIRIGPAAVSSAEDAVYSLLQSLDVQPSGRIKKSRIPYRAL
jgi:hypothetical protein